MSFNPKAHVSSGFVGVIAVFIYVLCGAVSAVYASKLFVNEDPIALVFVVFTIALVVYFSLLPDKSAFFRKARENALNVGLVNLATLLNWFCFMSALAYFTASFVNSLLIALIPIITLLATPYLRKNAKIHAANYILVFGCSIGVLAQNYFVETQPISLSNTEKLVGFGLVATTAAATSLYTFASKALSEAGFTARDVMGCRFFLLSLVSFGFVAKDGFSSIASNDLLIGASFTLVVGVFIGIYALQLGIERCEPLTVSFVFYCGPIIAIVFELFDRRIEFSLLWIGYTAALSAFLILMSVILSHRAKDGGA